MKKIVTNTLVPHKSRRSIFFLCLALFSLAATGSAQNLLTKTGGLTADPLQAIDQYGAIGSGKGLSVTGAILDAPLSTDITSSVTGRVWMDRNIGATKKASSYNDSYSYGDLYQWGRGTDGHQVRSSLKTSSRPPGVLFYYSTSNWLSPENLNLWQGLGGINTPCPTGYYVPTQAEMAAENITNLTSGNPLNMPAAGDRFGTDGSLNFEGSMGFYWTSTVSASADKSQWYQIFSGSASFSEAQRTAGASVRCIKGTIISAAGIVWMDRNLGATQVATSSTDTNAYGDLYQWGRATDGHQIRTSGTTTTLSSTDNPGNVGFIITNSANNDWRSPKKNNLWQGVNGTNNPCPSGFRLPSLAEFDNEILSWTAASSAEAFASLKLSVTGFRKNSDGLLEDVNVRGRYWTNTIDSNGAKAMDINVGGAGVITFDRGNGFAVRCIID